jgi:hypothetical protein
MKWVIATIDGIIVATSRKIRRRWTKSTFNLKVKGYLRSAGSGSLSPVRDSEGPTRWIQRSFTLCFYCIFE